MHKFISLILISLLTIQVQAQQFDWAKQVTGTVINRFSFFEFEPGNMIRDDQGNLYVTASFQDTLVLDANTTLYSSTNWPGVSGTDAFLAKFDPQGNLIWVNQITGGNPIGLRVPGLTTDPNGNVYIAGVFTFDMAIDSLFFTGLGDNDIFLAAYTGDGDFLWAKHEGGTRNEHVSDLNFGGHADDLYLGGTFQEGAVIAGQTLAVNGGSNTKMDIFIARYHPNGDAKSIFTSGGTSEEVMDDFEVDDLGNVYVAGQFNNDAEFGGVTFSGGTGSMYIVKFDSLGSGQWGDRDNEFGVFWEKNDIALDPSSGNVYLSGSFASQQITFGSTTLTRINPQGSDAYLVKYDPSGNVLWADNIYGVDMNPRSMEIDAQGALYVGGSFGSAGGVSPAIFGKGNDTISLDCYGLGGADDLFLAKYNPNGTLAWAQEACSYGDMEINVIALDGNGGAYICGQFWEDTFFGGTTLLNEDFQPNWYLAHLDPSGASAIPDPLEDVSLNIYPNPATDHITIDWESIHSRDFRLQVINIQGQQLLETEWDQKSNIQLTLTDLPAGLYLLRLQDASGAQLTQTIIKN